MENKEFAEKIANEMDVICNGITDYGLYETSQAERNVSEMFYEEDYPVKGDKHYYFGKEFAYEPNGISECLELREIEGNSANDSLENNRKVLEEMNSLDGILRDFYYDNSDRLDFETDDDFIQAYKSGKLDEEILEEADEYISSYHGEAPYFIFVQGDWDVKENTFSIEVEINNDAAYGRVSVPTSWGGHSADGSPIGMHKVYEATIPLDGSDEEKINGISDEIKLAVSVLG